MQGGLIWYFVLEEKVAGFMFLGGGRGSHMIFSFEVQQLK
jgi:hypothetical protein